MKRKSKQIAAWVCILLLLFLYAATFIVSFLDFPGSDKLFISCIAATIGLPILLWIYLWLFGKIKDIQAVSEDIGQVPNVPDDSNDSAP